MPGKPGRKPGQRTKRSTKPVSAEVRAQRCANLLRGGNNEAIVAARARKQEEYDAIQHRLRTCDIIEFATEFLKVSFDGYPFAELLLRCADGLPLPTGTLRTFVEVPSEGLAVKEVEMTWPEYFALCSGGRIYRPGRPYATIGARAGRRSGKSTACAIKVLHVGSRSKWREYLRSNETMKIPIVATSQDQAEEIITQRCHELLKAADMGWMIGALDPDLHLNQVTNDTIPLIVGTEISAFPCNSKKVRGEAAPLVVFDEYPHFAIDGRKKDTDIRAAATGAQGQFPGYQFLMIGTPAAEQGDFWETEQKAGDDSSILFLHAPSWTAAPVLYRKNPDYYHNQFRTDPDSFNREFRANYDKAVEPMYREEDIATNMLLSGEVPFDPRCKYGAGIDQSGLSGKDRFSLAICYHDPARDVCGLAQRKSWSASNLDLIMAECREALHGHGLYETMTDRYAKGYVHTALQKIGCAGVVAPAAAELHLEFRRLLVARKMELPIDNALKDALLQTQCFYTKTGAVSIAHPRSSKGHGDEVEALVRAAHQAVTGNFGTARQSESERQTEDRQRQEEENYDPLTYGRT